MMYAVTTPDNPYNPFDEFTKWYWYDVAQGYNTTNRLASITNTSGSFSENENSKEISRAIDVLISTGALSKEGKIVKYVKLERKE